MGASRGKTLERCLKQPPEVSFLLYADLIDTQPTAAHVPARVLREHGRAGRLTDDHIGPLLASLSSAPDGQCVMDLAKALATFGREAQAGVPFVVKLLENLNVVDDESFWTFDTLLYVLGYLGGADARTALKKIEEEEPPRPLRAKDLYRGEWEEELSAKLFGDSIARTPRRAAIPDGKFIGGWSKKETSAQPPAEEDAAPPQKMSPWMTR